MPLNLLEGVLAVFAVLALAFGVRFLVGLARTEGNAPLAWSRTMEWVTGIALAVGSATAVGLVSFGDIIGQAVATVASHPYIVSNLAIGGLGAGALSGAVQISTSQYIGLVLMIVGAVFMLLKYDEEGLHV